MRVLLKACLTLLCVVTVSLIVGFGWLYNSSGLPDAQALALFAPSSEVRVVDPCTKAASVAIPYNSIGTNLRTALNAAEAREDDPGVLTATYRDFTHPEGPHRPALSWRISRTMFCSPSNRLNRRLDELRAAIQVERRFSRQQMFTMFANRLEFGEDIVGVEAASQHFFHKHPSELSVSEAALVAGLAWAPSYLSPLKHPDRALKRRNEVIDAMAEMHAISESESSSAKAAPLPIVAN